MTIERVKNALCVPANMVGHPMTMWPTFLLDRTIADSPVPDPTNLQILPYVTILRAGDPDHSEATDNTYVLSYVRGKAGAEDRLHDLKSIGFGGHIEEEVTSSIVNLIVDETTRELVEELGYSPSPKLLHKAVLHSYRESRMIYLPETPVGSVHLGISVLLNYSEETNKPASFVGEHGQIEGLEWVCLDTMSKEEAELYEPWSLYLIQMFMYGMHEAKQRMLQELAERAKGMEGNVDPAVEASQNPTIATT